VAEPDKPSESYGALKRSAHVAGYSLEQALSDLEWLLKEDRWKSVGNFKFVGEFLDSIKLGHFRIPAEQRKSIANEIRRLTNGEVSNVAIAQTLGVNEITIRRDNSTNVETDFKKATPNGRFSNGDPTNVELSGTQAAKLVARQETKLAAAQQTQERREASRNAEPRVGDGLLERFFRNCS
jgi:hypothetical protein